MKTRCGKWFFIPLIGLIAVALIGWILMLLWNWLVPALFSGPVIGFWQALGLLLLSKILFSGIGRGHDRHFDHRHTMWKKAFHKKIEGETES
ncbi:hypothetical protein JW992_13130 [candidate division KSB1 bacterium]|nr:hypothetical protein [candidate division KSB1 bacterium]